MPEAFGIKSGKSPNFGWIKANTNTPMIDLAQELQNAEAYLTRKLGYLKLQHELKITAIKKKYEFYRSHNLKAYTTFDSTGLTTFVVDVHSKIQVKELFSFYPPAGPNLLDQKNRRIIFRITEGQFSGGRSCFNIIWFSKAIKIIAKTPIDLYDGIVSSSSKRFEPRHFHGTDLKMLWSNEIPLVSDEPLNDYFDGKIFDEAVDIEKEVRSHNIDIANEKDRHHRNIKRLHEKSKVQNEIGILPVNVTISEKRQFKRFVFECSLTEELRALLTYFNKVERFKYQFKEIEPFYLLVSGKCLGDSIENGDPNSDVETLLFKSVENKVHVVLTRELAKQLKTQFTLQEGIFVNTNHSLNVSN